MGQTHTGKTTMPKMRNSNLELFRIVLMLMIIAHHYVVNSGLTALYDFSHISGNQLFLEFFGWGGKCGINCFVLITGYFMCTKQFTWRKFLKLYLEIKFYRITIFLIFALCGYEAFSLSGAFKATFNVALGIGKNFPASFIALFLLIPFINKLIDNLSKKSHLHLLLVLLAVYSLLETLFFNKAFEYIGWYVTVYLIGAYLRLYPFPFAKNVKRCAALALAMFSLCMLSIIAFTYIPWLPKNVYYCVSDSNKILAITSAVSFFLLFNSIQLKPSRVINTLASATFGVFLIHANGPTMRHWLWHDTLKNVTFFNSDYLWLHAIVSIALVFAVCCCLDLARQYLFEKPLFKLLDRKFPLLDQ